MKYFIGAIGAFILVGVIALTQAQNMMFNLTPSPYGVEETAARIQANIQRLEGRGWHAAQSILVHCLNLKLIVFSRY
jgi:hypothetical protein